MYKVLDVDIQYNTFEYLVDDVEDISDLPTDAPGSTALIAATSDVYILNNQGQWTIL